MVMLGLPFNLLQISYLTSMLAHVNGMTAGKVNYTLGDVHIYKDHVDGLTEQLSRTSFDSYPKLVLDPSVKNFDDFTIDSFSIEDYQHQGKIYLPVST